MDWAATNLPTGFTTLPQTTTINRFNKLRGELTMSPQERIEWLLGYHKQHDELETHESMHAHLTKLHKWYDRIPLADLDNVYTFFSNKENKV
jgi:hypothetical protein